LGRLHLAKLLVARKYVRSIDEAFEKYLGEGAAAYFPKFKQTPFEAIKLINDSGGVAVMAHPILTERDQWIPMLVEAGLGGIEVHYPNSGLDRVNHYLAIARKYDLVVTGGSDAHGSAKTSTFIGKAYAPYCHVEELKSRAGKRS
jgi:predicted metal-dependent phosphoesterase TrpH